MSARLDSNGGEPGGGRTGASGTARAGPSGRDRPGDRLGDRPGDRPRPRGRALVTGASTGIGEEIARELARRGWSLVITARSEERLASLAAELRSEHGVQVGVIAGDLTQAGMPARLEEATEGSGVPIDLLVNNAGFGQYGEFLESDLDRELAMIQLNVTAVTELTKRFARPMAERGRGRILNVASTAAFQPGPLMSVYYATKAYVVSFSEALRQELRAHGVTVTTLCPGPTSSEFQSRARMEESPLFNRMSVPSSATVARYGVDATLAGRGIAVQGLMNRILATLTRFAPRSILPGIVRRIQEKRG